MAIAAARRSVCAGSGAWPRAPGGLAGAHLPQARQWPRGRSGRIAYHSQIHRRALCPQRQCIVATKAPGLAEITATVVRTGTEARSSRQIEEDLRRMGADIGTSAGADTSAIAFNGLTEFSSELLKLVAELAQQASFPEEEFERERRQIDRRPAHRAHHAFVPGKRALPARSFLARIPTPSSRRRKHR